MSSLRSEFSIALLIAFASASLDARAVEIDARVRLQAQTSAHVDVLLVFADQTQPVLPLRAGSGYKEHRRASVAALRARAEHAQQGVRAWLAAQGFEHHDFWIANLIQARLPVAALAALAGRRDLARIDPNPQIPLRRPPTLQASTAAGGVSWGVSKIEAPLVWAAGINGEGIVVGGEDTGYQWDHPALKTHYRGWNGSSADHNYSWHDAIHDATGNPCGNDTVAPCDDDSHGTHTAGTMVGDDGAGNQTGVAPGARWIGCRNMDQGNGTPARYIECMQWMLAPTDLDGNNPDSDLAPDIISNSWGCVPAEGCTTGAEIESAVDNLVDAGIFYAVAAGNDGDACGSIADPPAIYGAGFVVGATDMNDVLAGFSSRGPVGASSVIRPDLSAPGVAVCSSIPPDAYSCSESGTSMATPHVAGAAALLMSAFPGLKGKPGEVARILRANAVVDGVTNTQKPLVVQSCGGTSISTWPNYMAGFGRLDVWKAYRDIIAIEGFDD